MKFITLLFPILFLALLEVPAQTPSEPTQEESTSEEKKLTRIVGQPRTKSENDAWIAITKMENQKVQVRLVNDFLQNYPNSGLTAYAYRILADVAYQENNLHRFVNYGEKALEELPKEGGLLAQLSYIYAEEGKATKAINYATRALLALKDLEKPDNQPSLQWLKVKQGMKADANYALGRSHLEKWQKTTPRPINQLQMSIKYLSQALELAPDHAYAAFRLGFAQRVSQKAEAALSSYSRASVIESPAREIARKQSSTLLKNLKRIPESKWAKMSLGDVLKEEEKLMESKLAANEMELSRLAAQLDSRQLLQFKSLIPSDIPSE